MSITYRNGAVLLYVVWFFLLWVSFPVPTSAEEADAMTSRTCMKCHKRNGQMIGLHANSGLDIRCEDCHGEKGRHPKKGSAIKAFTADSPTAKTDQVATCLTCHDHQELAIAHWTHNVHANNVGCGECHQLHPKNDPVLNLQGSQRSQLCVTCHRAKR